MLVNQYLRDNPDNFSAKLYKELCDKYGLTITFEEMPPDRREGLLKNVRIRAEVVYIHERHWAIRLSGTEGPDLDRILSHELMHVALRYRQGLPYANPEKLTGTQIVILNAMENAIIKPLLDAEYTERDHADWGEEYREVLKKIKPYLKKITPDITKEKYLEILKKSLNACKESLPDFL